jgi:hypothetical protein
LNRKEDAAAVAGRRCDLQHPKKGTTAMSDKPKSKKGRRTVEDDEAVLDRIEQQQTAMQEVENTEYALYLIELDRDLAARER